MCLWFQSRIISICLTLPEASFRFTQSNYMLTEKPLTRLRERSGMPKPFLSVYKLFTYEAFLGPYKCGWSSEGAW